MNLALSKFNRRMIGQREIALAVIVMSALLAALWYFQMYSPSNDRIAELGNAISDLTVQVERGEAARRNLPALEDTVAQLKRDRDAFLAQLPRESDISKLLDELRAAATESNVSLDSISRSGGRDNDVQGVRPISFTLNTSGTYNDSMTFLGQLETLERFTKISQVSLSLDGEETLDPALRTSYTFNVYVFTGDAGDDLAGNALTSSIGDRP